MIRSKQWKRPIERLPSLPADTWGSMFGFCMSTTNTLLQPDQLVGNNGTEHCTALDWIRLGCDGLD
jgi:hypothetical protein